MDDYSNDVQTKEPSVSLQSGKNIEDLKKEIRGLVLTETDEGFDEARKVWNGVIDKRPAVIVKCSGTSDVIKSVNFARDNGLKLSVRGGGHNVAGAALNEGGLVIDLSNMRHVHIDPENKIARVSGGAKLGDIDHEAQAFALAVPSGVVSRTGIGGLSLNGGLGLLTRKYGLTSDNLVGAEVVTAEGKLVVANEHQNADLLWALKGGGGNFGVVTSFDFKLYPVGPEIFFALTMYPVEKAVDILRGFRDFMLKAPDEIMGIAIFWQTPEEEFIPEEYRGSPNLVIGACYSGPAEEGEEALKPLRQLATPIVDLSSKMLFIAAQRMFDPDYPDGRRYYWTSTYLKALNEEAMQAFALHASQRPSNLSTLDIWALGGAMERVRPEDSAFAQRNAPFLAAIESNWENPEDDEENITWSKNVIRDLKRFSTGGTYMNFPGFDEEGQAGVMQTFQVNFEKLKQVKAKYDPLNLFSGNLKLV